MAKMATPKGGFGYSSLIYALYLKAGVLTSASEEVLQPKPILSSEFVKSFKGARSRTPAGPSIAPACRSRQRNQPPPVDNHSEISAWFTKFTRLVDQMAVKHDQQYHHMMQCYMALVNEVPTRSGNPIQLPPAPAFSPYPPGDDDDEENAADDAEAAEEVGGDEDTEMEEEAEDEDDEAEESDDGNANTGDSEDDNDDAEFE